jgi:hypothetical protein
MQNLPEVWLRGPVPDIPPLLQPVAHALLQAREEVEAFMVDFPEEHLWTRPGGVASPGFHLRHLAGVIDRLFTYAKGDELSAEQLRYLKTEGRPGSSLKQLLTTFRGRVDHALVELQGIDEHSLTLVRTVGRDHLPSTLLGLLFHSAEHVQRHVGQLLVTVRVIQGMR